MHKNFRAKTFSKLLILMRRETPTMTSNLGPILRALGLDFECWKTSIRDPISPKSMPNCCDRKLSPTQTRISMPQTRFCCCSCYLGDHWNHPQPPPVAGLSRNSHWNRTSLPLALDLFLAVLESRASGSWLLCKPTVVNVAPSLPPPGCLVSPLLPLCRSISLFLSLLVMGSQGLGEKTPLLVVLPERKGPRPLCSLFPRFFIYFSLT